MKRLFAMAAVCCGGICLCGFSCSRDVMYGPNGEIVTMKSPDRTMKIKYEGDTVTIKGARGIGGRSRVGMPPVEVETDQEKVGVQGTMISPPSAPVVPVPAERSVEEKTVVH